MSPPSAAGRSPLAGPLFMRLSACLFTAMNVLLKQAVADFRIWDIGWRFFSGGALILCSAVAIQADQALRGKNLPPDPEVRSGGRA